MTCKMYRESKSQSLSSVFSALDAYCLLEVYDVLKHKIETYGLDIDRASSEDSTFGQKSSRSGKRHKKAAEKKMKPTEIAHSIVST